MVIAGMAAQGQRLIGMAAGVLKILRIQLIWQKFIRQPLINQNAGRERPPLVQHQLGRVMLSPGGAIFAQIGVERFGPPRTD